MNLNAFKIGDKYPVYTKKIDAKKDSVSGEWMIPAYATDVELIPEKAGFQRYFVKADQAWYYVVDNIGTEYWDEDGTRHIITKLGEEVPEGALFEAPVITPTVTELAAAARAKRDAWLSAISWRYERHASELRLGINVTDSIESLDTYAQTLRDITEQEGFPTTIDWPTEP